MKVYGIGTKNNPYEHNIVIYPVYGKGVFHPVFVRKDDAEKHIEKCGVFAKIMTVVEMELAE